MSTTSTTVQYGIPLHKGLRADLSFPHGMTDKDIKIIRDWLDLMEEVLTEPAPCTSTYLQPRRTNQIGGAV